MKLTEKRKNCPYCHKNILGQVKPVVYLSMDEDDWIDPDIHEAFIDPTSKDLCVQGNVSGRGEYATSKKINYCPMCGRPLNKESE